MRKRLFIFAAATCFALSAFAAPAFAEEPSLPDEPTISSEALVQSDGNSNGNSNENSDGNSNGNPNGNPNGNSDGNAKKDAPPSGSNDALESYSDEEQTSLSVVNSGVAKFGDVWYATLQEAIDAACKDTASSDATITLQKDLELNNKGLRFIGSDDPNTPWKKITLDADNHSLTLNDLGIYATRCEVTIKNCRELTVNAGTNPSDENANISAVFFCPGTLTLDKCATVNITNPEPKTDGGSGLCIYNGGDLYIQNNTRFTVSGFMNPGPAGKDGCSGIYMDRDDGDYRTIKGNIVVSGNSTLEATNCYHSGITANPVAITIRDHSELNVHDNNEGGSGQGGLSSYFGKLSVEESSRVVSQNNTAMQYSIYVHDLYVDGTSEIDASYNGSYDNGYIGGYGLAFSGTGILKSGAKVTATGNWGPGVAVAYYYHFDNKHNYEYDYPGSLIVEDGATISSCRNYNRGLANEWQLTIRSGAKVYLNENLEGGLDNYPDATATVENGANLVITGNGAYGIKNGNASFGNDSEATLTLGSGTITDNNKASTIPYHKGGALGVPYHNKKGGGICNENGDVTVSTSAVICNNKATVAGDDLYNYEDIPKYHLSGNIFNITTNPTDTKAVPGASGAVLKDDNKFIDYWYRDGKDNRWNEKDAEQYTEISLAPGVALKAAHDINAKTYEPPKPSPEPSPEPTVTPTPAPSASPAPTAAPTTAPADNTATAAPATPAPTAQPTVTATPAPTAQASGVIPQTGDSSSPALFSILTLGSITALCVLQKRRKSK